MPATIHKLPEALSDSEILAQLDDAPCDIHATRAERRARYARLARDCEARRARQSFEVVT